MFKVGEKVYCINPIEGYLTRGREYPVDAVMPESNRISVIDDNGKEGHFGWIRFISEDKFHRNKTVRIREEHEEDLAPMPIDEFNPDDEVHEPARNAEGDPVPDSEWKGEGGQFSGGGASGSWDDPSESSESDGDSGSGEDDSDDACSDSEGSGSCDDSGSGSDDN